ncbi:MAG: hypothetical protein R2838_16890 [Caldilineaceae bacterium]
MINPAVVGWAIVVLLLGVVLAGCTTVVAPAETAADAMPAMAPEPGKITVMDARSRPSPMAGGNGAAYLVVLNGLDADVQLTSAPPMPPTSWSSTKPWTTTASCA